MNAPISYNWCGTDRSVGTRGAGRACASGWGWAQGGARARPAPNTAAPPGHARLPLALRPRRAARGGARREGAASAPVCAACVSPLRDQQPRALTPLLGPLSTARQAQRVPRPVVGGSTLTHCHFRPHSAAEASDLAVICTVRPGNTPSPGAAEQ